MQGRKRIKKTQTKNEQEKVYSSPLIDEDVDHNYELERAPLKRQRDSHFELEQRNYDRQSFKKNKDQTKPTEIKSYLNKAEQNGYETLSRLEDQLQLQKAHLVNKSSNVSRRYNYTPNYSMFQTMMNMFEPSKYYEQVSSLMTQKVQNSSLQFNSTSNPNNLVNFNLDIVLNQKQKNPQVEVQKQKIEILAEKNQIQNYQQREEQFGHPRHIGTLKRNQQITNISEDTIRKLSFGKQGQLKPILPNPISPPTVTLNSNIFTIATVQSHPSPPFLFKPTIPVSSAQPIAAIPVASNLSSLASSIPQNNDNLLLKTTTFGNQRAQFQRNIENQQLKSNTTNVTNASIFSHNILQNLNIKSDNPNIFLNLQQQWAYRNLLFHLTSHHQGPSPQNNKQQVKQDYSKINLLYSVGILPNILPQKVNQNKSNLFHPNQNKYSNALQFQRNICQIKRIYEHLPTAYYFDMIGSLKIKDLKDFHKYFAFLTRNIQLIKTKLSLLLAMKSQTDLKYRQIGSKGMDKLLKLKKTYLFENQAKNKLFENTKMLDIIYNQVKIIEPVTVGYLYHKECPFYNPDQGVILLAQLIKQKYRELYQKYKESVKIHQNLQNSTVDLSEILQEQIQLVYVSASHLADLQKKIKNLKSIMSARHEEKLNLMFQNKINKEMDQSWRDLNLFFELGQIFEGKLKRGRQWLF